MLYLLQKKELHRHITLTQNLNPLHKHSLSKQNLYQDKNGIEWKDNNREVIIDGTYFEVVEVRVEKEVASLYLVEDKNESNLFKWFFFELDEEDEKNKERLTDHIDFYFTAFTGSNRLDRRLSILSYSVCKQPHLAMGHLSLNFIPPKNMV